MKSALIEIKKRTQNMVCSVHGEHAEAVINGDKIEFKCCCEPFKEKLLEVSKTAFGNHAKEVFTKMLKDAFKGSKNIRIK